MERVVSAVCREVTVPVPWGVLAAKLWSHPSPQPGPTWLALHGWLDNAGSFDLLAPRLISHCPHLSLLCLDYPGHGLSSHLARGQMYHFLDCVSYIRRVANHLHIEKFGLIGHSMGAAKASLFAATYPDMVESLVMIDLIKPISRKTEDVVEKTRLSIEMHSSLEDKIEKQRDKVYKSEEEALEKLLQAARDHGEGSLTHQSGRVLLRRGLRDLEGGRDKVFSRDLRQMSVFSLNGLSQEVLEQFAKNIKCPHLLIKASDSPNYENPEVLERFLEIYRRNPLFTMATVKGSHHLHLNSPERVLPPVVDFIKTIKTLNY